MKLILLVISFTLPLVAHSKSLEEFNQILAQKDVEIKFLRPHFGAWTENSDWEGEAAYFGTLSEAEDWIEDHRDEIKESGTLTPKVFWLEQREYITPITQRQWDCMSKLVEARTDARLQAAPFVKKVRFELVETLGLPTPESDRALASVDGEKLVIRAQLPVEGTGCSDFQAKDFALEFEEVMDQLKADKKKAAELTASQEKILQSLEMSEQSEQASIPEGAANLGKLVDGYGAVFGAAGMRPIGD